MIALSSAPSAALAPSSRSAAVQLTPKGASTERPTGKYWVVVDTTDPIAVCLVYRNGTLLTQAHGRTGRDAWHEAHRGVRMARHCGLKGSL